MRGLAAGGGSAEGEIANVTHGRKRGLFDLSGQT
jgi:hypothetical protein